MYTSCTITHIRLCHPDVITCFSCAVLLGHRLPWGEMRGADQSVFSPPIIDSNFLSICINSFSTFLSQTSLISVFLPPGDYLFAQIVAPEKRQKGSCPSQEWRVWRGRRGCRSHALEARGNRLHSTRTASGEEGVGVEMKLKQRMVVLCAVLLLLGLAKLFLLDGGDGSAANRRDLRAFRKVRVQVRYFCLSLVRAGITSFWTMLESFFTHMLISAHS